MYSWKAFVLSFRENYHTFIKGELEVLHLEAEARQDRERAEKEVLSKEGEIRKLMSNHDKMMRAHLKEVPAPGGLSRALSKYLSTKKNEAKAQGVTLSEKQRSVTNVRHWSFSF